MGEALAFVIISWACAALFIGIGIFALNKKTPMHFWSGSTVRSEQISDIKAYNRANGIMWITYGSTFVLCGILVLVAGGDIGGIFMGLCTLLGSAIMIFVYLRIYKKYKI